MERQAHQGGEGVRFLEVIDNGGISGPAIRVKIEPDTCLSFAQFEEMIKEADALYASFLELNPCPFCGGKAEYDDSPGGGIRAGCPKCHIWTGGYGPAWVPARKWNRRKDDTKEADE